MPETIQKRTHPKIREYRLVRDGKDGLRIFCEGQKVVNELLASGWKPEAVLCTERNREETRTLLQLHGMPAVPLLILDPSVMEFISDLITPPGVIAIAKRQIERNANLPVSTVSLVIHGLRNPQNVGAILRTAEAAGVSHVWVTSGTADPLSPKSIRGSSGSAFRLMIHQVTSLGDVASAMRETNIKLVAAMQKGETGYHQVDWTIPSALVLGPETGFQQDDLTLFDKTVKIPMAGRVESLNVAVAAGVCLFEAVRQNTRSS